jgi:L,D-peptidoglycan transpeptidase YkuD (ErfK/YbiS/YcfS/YnhG family)
MLGPRIVAAFACAIVAIAGCTSSHHASSITSTDSVSVPSSTSAITSASPTATVASPHHGAANSSRSSARPTSSPASPPKPAGAALPLSLPTGDATQVITVVAPSMSSTTATLQAWAKDASGWHQFGSPTEAWLGSDGLSAHPSESLSATPIGSFTMTRAFGRDANPGTALPYLRTQPDDWWISQAGSLYNTEQRCSGNCGFTLGDPNEHLYYEVPYYDYAVVIDYNTANSPTGVVQGAGSAFFLHVAVGAPTAGCVAIDQSRLVQLLGWLRPAARPRILIGVNG